jgi:hypothetical protein
MLSEAGEVEVPKFGCAFPVGVRVVFVMLLPQLSISNDSVAATSTGLKERISNLQ